jgi:hypothetical protein
LNIFEKFCFSSPSAKPEDINPTVTPQIEGVECFHLIEQTLKEFYIHHPLAKLGDKSRTTALQRRRC